MLSLKKDTVFSMDKISVITVCYNESSKICLTLESVMSQTYGSVEYIVKDGDSQDDTNGLIQAYIGKSICRDVKHIIRKDEGIYDAMNQALAYCTGDWVIFMNAGDCFLDERVLENIFQNLSYDDAAVIYGDVLVEDISGISLWKAEMSKLPYRMPFSHQACFMRRQLIQKLKFDQQYKIAADFEMILRCHEQRIRFCYCGQTIAKFMLDGVSSTDYLRKEKDHYSVLANHHLIGTREKWIYVVRIILAYVKNIISVCVPKSMQIIFRKFYLYRIKKYLPVSK